ncbi:hypothetical protein BC938DRAFT_475701 [Jimgerdemannia flammicorona]|uniref:F-box domain-containing protein n=1 Tax=Jimgerdemannia flammicorona TaxID=994334 RepID=A0A433PQ28_9FUNG|nr:hypothetical protein BC938DRAFT_475701 [Jimgerdemannia flammicorona]
MHKKPQDTFLRKRRFSLLFPTEISLHALSFLNLSNIARASAVSRLWNQIAYSPDVWRSACLDPEATTDPHVEVHVRSACQRGGAGKNFWSSLMNSSPLVRDGPVGGLLEKDGIERTVRL